MAAPRNPRATNQLHRQRSRTCPCGKVFEARRPAATYCSQRCYRAYTRYGQTHGQVEPRPVDRAFR